MLKINSLRFLDDLQKQGQIGWKEGCGLFREAYSDDYFKTRDFLKSKMEEIGLKTWVDNVGNLFGRLEGENPNAPAILTGSHLDSVKGGGIFDGTLGVFAGLEALRSIKESGHMTRHPLELVGFIAEEGGPLGGTFGSRAFTGLIEDLPSDEVLKDFGLSSKDIESSKVDIENYGAFLELHIEQGPVLWKRGISIGIPSAIVGITRYRARIIGSPNHAGTTPMNERKDALYEAVMALYEWLNFMRAQEEIVCNIGYIEMDPGHISIVPGEVRFGVEIRAVKHENVRNAVDSLKDIFSEMKTCKGDLKLWIEKPSVKLSDQIADVIEQVSHSLELKYHNMPSWASHDASPIANAIPTGMIFVPSVKGISHSKEEFTEKEDILNGANVLLNTLLKLDLEMSH